MLISPVSHFISCVSFTILYYSISVCSIRLSLYSVRVFSMFLFFFADDDLSEQVYFDLKVFLHLCIILLSLSLALLLLHSAFICFLSVPPFCCPFVNC